MRNNDGPQQRRNTYLTPYQKIMIGFALTILLGAFLLSLPQASVSGKSVGFLDALFTATSANCVTGLVVVNTAQQWTWFGKTVILVLIQFGGWGFMTVMTAAMLLIRRNVTLRSRQAIQVSFNQDSIGGMVKLVRKVVFISLIMESAGALLLMLFFFFSSDMGLWESFYQGVFHSVSAFCNAGFDNIGLESLIPFQINGPVNLVIMFLIIAGGIGFTVWSEVGEFIRNRRRRSLRLRLIHLSLHSKIVFTVTGILILSGTLFFLLFEWGNPETLASLPIRHKVLAALFQSVTLRTAGFNTVQQGALTEPSLAVSCFLMIVGGSSASTAGGMKTVTLGIIIISVISVLKGRDNLEAFGRTLPLSLLQNALAVAMTMLIVVFTSTLLLYFTEQGSVFPHTLLDLLFESSSAAGTVGVSTGITPYLSPAGKLVITICMYLGRLSPVTVVIALNAKLHADIGGIKFLEERVIIG